MPTSMIATINSEVATGRRMNGRDGLMRYPYSLDPWLFSPATALSLLALALAASLPARLARRLRRRRTGRLSAAFGDLDLGAFLEPVGAVGDDDLPRIEPFGDRDLLAVVGAERHHLRGHRVVRLDQVDKRARRAALDRRAGDDGGVLDRVDAQLDV